MTKPQTRPLHICFTGRLAAIVRQHARSQGVTNASMVRAAVKNMMDKDGGEYIFCPWGSPDFVDCFDNTAEVEDE